MDGLLVIESRQPSRPVHGASSVVMTRTDTWHKKVISSRLFKTHVTLWPKVITLTHLFCIAEVQGYS